MTVSAIKSDPEDTRRASRLVGEQLVGRERELELLLSAVAAGRDVVLEGPSGTSKTTMLQALTAHWGIPLLMVEGNAELTAPKLVGHHDPARVLRDGYSRENFVPGPLVEAMQRGGFLYIEELNRTPDDTLNTLLMAIADRRLAVPRFGVVEARPDFRLIASMNPFDDVGTHRLSMSIHDRLCRLALDYQEEPDERAIVTLRSGPNECDTQTSRLVADAVWVTRATRTHADVRQGSSVRGAIDTVLVGRQLAALRADGPAAEYGPILRDAMTVALSGRIQLDETAETTPEAVLGEIWDELMRTAGRRDAPG